MLLEMFSKSLLNWIFYAEYSIFFWDVFSVVQSIVVYHYRYASYICYNVMGKPRIATNYIQENGPKDCWLHIIFFPTRRKNEDKNSVIQKLETNYIVLSGCLYVDFWVSFLLFYIYLHIYTLHFSPIGNQQNFTKSLFFPPLYPSAKNQEIPVPM